MTADDLGDISIGAKLYGVNAVTYPGQTKQTWSCGLAGRYLAGNDVRGLIAVTDGGRGVVFWCGRFLFTSMVEAENAVGALNAGNPWGGIKPNDFVPPVLP